MIAPSAHNDATQMRRYVVGVTCTASTLPIGTSTGPATEVSRISRLCLGPRADLPLPLVSQAVHTIPSRSLGAKVGAFVALTKPRIIELLLVTTVPTMFLAARGGPSIWLMVATVIGGTRAAGGARFH